MKKIILDIKKEVTWWAGFEACQIFQCLLAGAHVENYVAKPSNLDAYEKMSEMDVCLSAVVLVSKKKGHALINIIPKTILEQPNQATDNEPKN
jgi:TctA family transporter